MQPLLSHKLFLLTNQRDERMNGEKEQDRRIACCIMVSFTRSAMLAHPLSSASQNGAKNCVSRQELVEGDRQVADTDAGRMIDGISNSGSGPDNANLANPF